MNRVRSSGEGLNRPILVYRKHVLPGIALATAISAFLGLIVWVYFRSVPHVLLGYCIAMAMAWWPLPLEWRRRVIFADQHMEYRYNVGRPLEVIYDEIVGVEETSATYMFGFRPVAVPALKLTLRNGVVYTLPLDFPRRDEIVARVKARAGTAQSRGR
jgi:hypothetical protein